MMFVNVHSPQEWYTWNNLPDYVVDVDSVDVYYKRLDKFWANQPVKFDSRASLTGKIDQSIHLNKAVKLSIDIGDADI